MNTYYIITAKIEGQIEELFGSFNKKDCQYELEAEKDSWKAEGFKSIKIESKKVEGNYDANVYPELEAENLIEEYIEVNDSLLDINIIKEDQFDWNLYDIQGYSEDLNELSREEIDYLKQRVKALKELIKVCNKLEKFTHVYS